MKSLRIAHIADTHLGYRSSTVLGRSEDFATSWVAACRAIVDSKPDLILHAGDVFHRPNPSWESLRDFLEGTSILEEAKVPIFMISGNHDSSRITTKHTVFSVISKVAPFLTVSYDSSPQVYRLDEVDTEIVLLSHQTLLNTNLRDLLKSTLSLLGTRSHTILVAHGDVRNLEKFQEMGSIVIPDFVFDYPWSYVALGHLHLAQPYGPNGWYSGSIERCGWSDYPAEPGWTLTTLSDGPVRHEQRPLPHMPMIQLPNLECGGENEVNIPSSVLDALERVKVPDERSVARILLQGVHPFSRRSIQSITQRLVKDKYPKLQFQVTTESSLWEKEDPSDAPQGKEFQSIEDLFKDFVESRIFEDDSIPARLTEVGSAALAKAREMEASRDL